MRPLDPREPTLEIVKIDSGPTPHELEQGFWKDQFAIYYDPKKSVDEIATEVTKKIESLN